MMSCFSKRRMIPGELGREVELHETVLMGFVRCPIRHQAHAELREITHFLKHEKTCGGLVGSSWGWGTITDSQDF